MAPGSWAVGSGQRPVGSRQRVVGGGQWAVGSGRRALSVCPFTGGVRGGTARRRAGVGQLRVVGRAQPPAAGLVAAARGPHGDGAHAGGGPPYRRQRQSAA